MIDQASERFTKNLWTNRVSAERPYLVTVRDEADQAHYVADQVLAYREEGLGLKQQAVLFRTAHHSGPSGARTTRRNIPFKKFGGLKFLDAAHVKDILAILRFVQNPRDKISAFRVLLLLPGIGPRSANDIINAMTDAPHPLTAISTVSPPPRTGEAWDDFIAMLRDLKPGAIGWPAEIELVRDWYQPHLERTYEDAGVRNDDLRLEKIKTVGDGLLATANLLLLNPDPVMASIGCAAATIDGLVGCRPRGTCGWASISVLWWPELSAGRSSASISGDRQHGCPPRELWHEFRHPFERGSLETYPRPHTGRATGTGSDQGQGRYGGLSGRSSKLDRSWTAPKLIERR